MGGSVVCCMSSLEDVVDELSLLVVLSVSLESRSESINNLAKSLGIRCLRPTLLFAWHWRLVGRLILHLIGFRPGRWSYLC